MTVSAKPPSAEQLAAASLITCGAAFLAAAVWAAAAILLHYRLDIVAWGVGAAAGFAMMSATSARGGWRTGAVAAAATLAALVAGKAAYIAWHEIPATIELEVMREDAPDRAEVLFARMEKDRISHAGEISPELSRWLDDAKWLIDSRWFNEADPPAPPPELRDEYARFHGEIDRRIAAIPNRLDVGWVTRQHQRYLDLHHGWGQRFLVNVDLFQLLFLVLALASAWLLGSGLGTS